MQYLYKLILLLCNVLFFDDFDLFLFYWFNEGDDALDDDCH